jgi:hypothetical protein
MFLRGSRYEKARSFEKDPVRGEVFRGVLPRAIGPATGVLEHVVRSGDRLELLARHYYNDSRLWWRILDANPGFLYGGELTLDHLVGRIILIPRAVE